MCARVLVLLIMSRDIPNFYLHLGGTHVHHLNYGIFLLSTVGAVLLFAPPKSQKNLHIIAAMYGIGLALTFDEFGMWLHLGGSYWQRASFDAITVIGGLLLLLAFTPPLQYWNRRRFAVGLTVLSLLIVFSWRLSLSLMPVEQQVAPKLKQLEKQGPI